MTKEVSHGRNWKSQSLLPQNPSAAVHWPQKTTFSPGWFVTGCTALKNPLPQHYPCGEAYFATGRTLPESLARFDPPGFRLGTPSPGSGQVGCGRPVAGRSLLPVCVWDRTVAVLVLGGGRPIFSRSLAGGWDRAGRCRNNA